MGVEDIQRIDGLIVKICDIVDKRPREFQSGISYTWAGRRYYCIPDNVRHLSETISISSEDLDFLVQQEAANKKNPDELIAEFRMKPEDYISLYNDYVPLLRQKSCIEAEIKQLGWECQDLENKLSGLRKLFSKKTTKQQRRDELQTKKEELKEGGKKFEKVCLKLKNLEDNLGNRVSNYASVKRYVLTDKGVYVSLKPEIQRYVDLNFKPTRIMSSDNSLSGTLVFFYPKEGAQWDEEASYNPSEHGEKVELKMNIPYEQLTEVNVNRKALESKIAYTIAPKQGCIDAFIEGRGSVCGGYLEFTDRRFWMQVYPTSANVSMDVTRIIGTTSVDDWSPQGCHTETRVVDLYERTVLGEFKFDLAFDRLNSKGQSFRG